MSTEYASWQSGEVENLVCAGSTPASVTQNWAARLTGRHLACNQKTGVRFLGGPLPIRLDSEMDIMPRFERGVPGSNPGRGTET